MSLKDKIPESRRHSQSPQQQKKATNLAAFRTSDIGNRLLDFGFLEIHVLFGNRVVFAFHHFLGHGAAVFLGYVKETGVCGALKLDLDGCGLCHCLGSVIQRK